MTPRASNPPRGLGNLPLDKARFILVTPLGHCCSADAGSFRSAFVDTAHAFDNNDVATMPVPFRNDGGHDLATFESAARSAPVASGE